ncbi:MAG TPA: zf-HC2 domain-containing protein [Spirochaetia bacterium]|nr:zf-HC2 domain-containing protein [Spirochaetia bacterium]
MCPDRQIISAYLDGEIEAPWDKAIAEHLASCVACRSLYDRMAETKRALREDPVVDVQGSMERVRRQLRERVRPVVREPAVWARRVSLPLPLAALAAALLLFFGITLAITQFRPRIGLVRITKAPAGGTEIQISAPISELETLLKTVGAEDAAREDVIVLPKNVRLLPVGEPRMGKAAEFPKVKTW